MYKVVSTILLILFFNKVGFGQETSCNQALDTCSEQRNAIDLQVHDILVDIKAELETVKDELKVGLEEIKRSQNNLKQKLEALMDLKDSRYLFPKVKSNWTGARTYCQERGKDLVSIETETEHLFLKYLIRIENATGDYPLPAVWTSGNELAEEDRFVWEPTGKEFVYTSWLPGEPNDNKGNDEDCVSLHQSNLDFNDAPCDYVTYFICE